MAGPFLQNGRSRRDPNLVAMLSFYLLLLAFFILLNALSEPQEDRARMVLESVNAAFDGRVQTLESANPTPAALGALRDAAALLDDLRRLFQTTIPATATAALVDGAVMRMSLGAESLFRPGRDELQPGRALLLQRLSEALLNERNAGLFFEVELLHGVPEAAGGTVAAAGARSLEIRRLGQLVGRLEDFGLPRERLSIGIVPGDPGVIQFLVRIFDKPPESIGGASRDGRR